MWPECLGGVAILQTWHPPSFLVRRFTRSSVQVAQQPRQVHFPLSGLEAALERCLESALRLGIARSLAEEIGVATEVLDRCERDRIDAVLDRGQAGGRKLGDPMRERSDEVAKRVDGQRAFDPAVPFGYLRVVILRA